MSEKLKNKILDRKFTIDGSFTREAGEGGKRESDGSIKIAGYANTGSKDRHDSVLAPEVWSNKALKSFKRNPIMLFNHNTNEPIGKFSKVKKDDKGLYVEGTVYDEKIAKLVEQEVLKTFSVGFRVTNYETLDYDKKDDTLYIKDVDLMEVSIVSTPSNTDSLFEINKCFDNKEQYEEFKKSVAKNKEEVTVKDESVDTDLENEELESSDSESKEDRTEESEVKDSKDSNQTNQGDPAMDNTNQELVSDKDEAREALAHAAGESTVSDSVEYRNETNEDVREATEALAETRTAPAAKVGETEGAKADRAATELEAKGDFEGAKEIHTKNSDAIMEERANKFDYSMNNEENPLDNEDTKRAVVNEWFYAKAKGENFYKSDTGAKFARAVSTDPSLLTTLVSEDVFRIAKPTLRVYQSFPRFTMESGKNSMPIQNTPGLTDINLKAGGTRTINAGALPAENQVSQEGVKDVEFDPNTAWVNMAFDYEDVRDLRINVLESQRTAAVVKLSRYTEHSILNGSGTRAAVISGTNTQSTYSGLTTLAGTTFRVAASTANNNTYASTSLFSETRGKMGEIAVTPDRMAIFCSPGQYSAITRDDNFITRDKMGDLAGIATGTVGSIFGMQVIPTPFLDDIGADNKNLAVVAALDGFMICDGGDSFEVEVFSEPLRRARVIQIANRVDFKAMTTETNNALSASFPYAYRVVTKV